MNADIPVTVGQRKLKTCKKTVLLASSNMCSKQIFDVIFFSSVYLYVTIDTVYICFQTSTLFLVYIRLSVKKV